MEIRKSLLKGRFLGVVGYLFLLSLPFFMGCATVSHKDNVLAVVDEAPVTEADLAYALQISHRREDLSSAGSLDISPYIEKLIDERLIFDEARRMGLDQLPEVREKAKAYITRESVMRLHDEEVLRKISVTDEDVLKEYAQNYFHFGVIVANSADEAKAIKEKISGGEDFSEAARTYSVHASKEKGGEVAYPRDAIVTPLREALSALKPGDCSDVINVNDKYYLVKLFDNKETDEILNARKKDIAANLKKQRQKEIENSYLKTLREKAPVTINEELLAGIDFAAGKEELEKRAADATPLAEVNAEVITVGDFVSSVSPMKQEMIKTAEDKKRVLDSLIDVKVLDQEALSRHYEMKDLKDEVERYENYLVREAFIRQLMSSRMNITEKQLTDYYAENQKQFTNPPSFKLQQIRVRTREEAEEAMASLKNGADFLWLAKEKLPPSLNEDSISLGWVEKDKLPGSLQKIIDPLKPGDNSPVFESNGYYAIVRLLDKSEGKVKDFESVRETVSRAVFEKQYKEILDGCVADLRGKALITVDDAAVRELEARLQK
ncbi:MAG: hypothetical protein EHM54_02120 [Nitrospiraceae bacterium]|nr:MAG: hypothetical protein EHM54_02120 [Nitrospiraceae bacterium]